MTTKIKTSNIDQATLETIGGGPKIANVQIANSTYGALDDTAVSLSGGYIILNGNNFGSNTQLVIGDTLASSITVVSNTVIRAQVPAKTAGSYILYLTNQTTGSVAIRVNGLTYSGTPSWVTDSTLPDSGIDEAISIQLNATSDSNVSYQVQAGSTLPAGLTLAANGLFTGTVTGIEEETIYNFIVEAIDVENQESPRSFSITITSGDEYFYATTLLLNGDGANGANNNTFVDSSNNNFAITRNGNVAQGTFSPFAAPEGRWSNFFDGTGDYLSVADNTALRMDSGNFTIEFWINFSSIAGYQTAFSKGYVGSGDLLFQTGNGNGRFVIYASGSAVITESGTATVSEWVHYALVRNSATLTLYRNGVSSGSDSNSTNLNSTIQLLLGAANAGASGSLGQFPITGYISNLRIVKGTAVYTGNFTPPTAPLTAITNTSLLTCQSNRFKDNSANNFAITRNGDVTVTSFTPFASTGSYSAATNGGSGYFDGSGDVLSVPDNDSWVLGNNFTIECWIYFTNISGIQQFIWQRTSVNDAWQFLYNWPNSGDLTYKFADSNVAINRTWSPTTNQWYHIAVTRNGNTWYLFVNGVQLGATATNSTTFPNIASNVFIGAGSSGAGEPFIGYMSSMRVIKSSIYTSNFTPSTSPLTNLDNTQLLLNFTNGGIIDYTGKNNLETVGNAQISTSVKKYGTGSIILSPGGGSHYTKMPLTEELKFGTRDFTIECWIYLITNAAGVCAVWSNYSAFNADSLSFFAGHSGSNSNLFILAHSNVFPAMSSSTTINSRLNVWTHLALVRYNGQIKMYINGTSEGTPIASTNTLNGQGGVFWIGTTGDGATNPNCYIDDLRITKGHARYTANFTPPTSAHRLR